MLNKKAMEAFRDIDGQLAIPGQKRSRSAITKAKIFEIIQEDQDKAEKRKRREMKKRLREALEGFGVSLSDYQLGKVVLRLTTKGEEQ